jgi:putative ABC transport system permease protein
MIIWEIFKMALGALRANRMRTSLTLLGVIIGVTSVITIISAIDGLSQSIRQELEVLKPTTFIVDRFGLIMSEDAFMDALKRKPIEYEYMKYIEEGCPDCDKLAAISYAGHGEAKYNDHKLTNIGLVGATSSVFDVTDLKIEQGRFYYPEEDQSRSRVAFIGAQIAEELYSGLDPIGRNIKLNNINYQIIGVAKKKGSGFGDNSDKNIYVPYSIFVRDFKSHFDNLNIYVGASSLEKVPEAIDQTRVVLRAVRHVPYNKEDDFGIFTAEAIMDIINNVTRYIRFGLIGISSIALVVGGIIVMNIMMVSVTERTREIGIRKAIGAKQKNILMQFLFEALLISLSGGIIGIAVGVILGKILINMINMDMTPSAFAIIAGLIISSGVGLFFGIYPAMKAARLQPVKALSYE